VVEKRIRTTAHIKSFITLRYLYSCLTKLTVARTPVYSKSISNTVTLSAQMNIASCAGTVFPVVIDYCDYVLHAYKLYS